jgi:hypothetical protein
MAMDAASAESFRYFMAVSPEVEGTPSDLMTVSELRTVCDGYRIALENTRIAGPALDEVADKFRAAIENNPTATAQLTRQREEEFQAQQRKNHVAQFTGHQAVVA